MVRGIKKINVKTRHVPSFLFAVIAIMVMFAIYHNDSTLGGDGAHGVLVGMIYAFFVLAVVFLLSSIKLDKIRVSSLLVMLSVLAVVVLDLLSSYDTAKIAGLTVLLCLSFCLFPKDLQLKTFEVFRKIWVLACVVGVFCYLAYALNLPVPYERVQYYFGTDLWYVDYGVSFLYDNGNLLRLCGICNEPGYFGTFCALLLCVDKFNLKKKSNVAILIAGLLTFSAAFVMIVVIYLALDFIVKAHKEKDAGRKILRYIGVVVMVVLYLAVMPNIETGISGVDAVLHRVTLTSEGLAGDNRTTTEFDGIFESMTPEELLFGKGRGYLAANNVVDNSSYKIYVLEYGIVGSVLVWGILLAAALYKNTKNANVVIFVMVFFASIYQRPNVITLPYLMLLLGGIEYIKVYMDAKESRYLKKKNEVRRD